MKTFPISAVLMIGLAAPVSAGLLADEQRDSRAHCASTTARMIINSSEDGVIFPDDISHCGEADTEAVENQTNDSGKSDPAGGADLARSFDLAKLTPGSAR